MLQLLLMSLVLLAAPAEDAPVERVAFGSCCRESQPAPIFDAINGYRPDVFIFLGDNVYGDTDDVDELAEKYETLGKLPGVQRLRDAARILYIWDDHDYGQNDAGAEWPLKDEAKRAMLDFFGEPADSERRKRSGNYDAVTLGPPGQRVQFILLDTRWFRSPLKQDPEVERKAYIGDESPEATVLGPAQWKWLEAILKEPADVRVICTSIQLLPYEHRFEKWGNFPRERDRLLKLLEDVPDALILSGDRHSGEISAFAYPDGRVLVEVTASALNQGRGRVDEPNRYRGGPLVLEPNFGTLTIDWPTRLATVALHDVDGQVIHQLTLRMAEGE